MELMITFAVVMYFCMITFAMVALWEATHTMRMARKVKKEKLKKYLESRKK